MIRRLRDRWRYWWQHRQLNKLIKRVRNYEMTPEEREEQRRSFAYGNVHLSNPDITRKMVDEAADRLNQETT